MAETWIRGNARIEQLLADPERRARVEEIVAQMRAQDQAAAGAGGAGESE